MALRTLVSNHRRLLTRAGSGVGPGLRITERPACLFRVQSGGFAHACGDRAYLAHLPCGLLAPVTAYSLPTSVPLVGPAAARALQLGPSSHRRRPRCSQDVASRTHACSGGTTVLLPRSGTPRRTAPFGDGLAQLARRSPRTRCLWFVRCLFFCSPEALSACGLLKPVTCTEAVSRLIHRA